MFGVLKVLQEEEKHFEAQRGGHFKDPITMQIEDLLKIKDFNLQKISSIAVAVNFWELQNVKNKIKEFFSRDFDKGIREWKNLILEYVIKLVDSFGFPLQLLNQIKDHVFVIGGSIFAFVSHTVRNGIYINFGLKICWSSYGRIDELRTIREWLKESTDNLSLENSLHCLASVYADEDLSDKYNRLINETKWEINARLRELYRTSLYTRRLAERTEDDYKRSDEEWFLLCCDWYFYERAFLVRYFWNRLNSAEKENNIVIATEVFLGMADHFSNSDKEMYLRQIAIEQLFVFMQEMSTMHRLTFALANYIHLFEIFLKSWPHREFCVNFINDHVRFGPDHLERLLHMVLECLIARMPQNRYNYSPISITKYKDRNSYHAVLQKLLDRSPKEVKLDFFERNLKYFEYLHENFDYVTISMIVSDDSLKVLKDQIILQGRSWFEYFVYSGNYDDLIVYMDHVLDDENEKKLFKRRMYDNWINDLVCAGKFELATKNINWVCDTDIGRKELKNEIGFGQLKHYIEDRAFALAEKFIFWRYDEEVTCNLKNEIDSAKLICKHLIQEKQFVAISDYLIWLFGTEEERADLESMRYNYDSYEYLRNKFFQVWSFMDSYKDSQSRNDVCTAFLKLFLKSEEAVEEFRRYKLMHSDSFIKNLKNFGSFESCREYLIYCFQTRDQIREVRGYVEKLISKDEI